VKVTHGRLAWVRRLSFAAVLIVAAITPGQASSGSLAQCQNEPCVAAGTVRWIRSLPGSWAAQNGMTGTTPEQGQAYAALGSDVAAVGLGTTVSVYAAGTGQPLWTTGLTGFQPGAAIMSVRVWPGVVTIGVALPAEAGGGTGSAAGPVRDEVVLRAATGRLVRVYPAAQFGGAVAASGARTVIVGQHSVTSYANHTGKVIWSRPTGEVPQPWQVDGNHLYLSVAAGDGPGGAPVTALRRLDLGTGAERIVRPHGPAFTGAFSLAFGGAVLFADASAVRAYSETTGQLLWHYRGALPDAVDAVAGRLYLISGNTLVEVSPGTGRVLAHVAGAAAASSSGLYAVRHGDVLGIDHGALGKAWGYDVEAQQVVWTSRPLPWPHYFVDLSGIGGSAPPDQAAVLLAICAQVGAQPTGTGPPRCTKPELALVDR
jgi:PQQ-like domain